MNARSKHPPGKVKQRFEHIIQFIRAPIRAFIRDECNLKAALLTFYSLVSIVPFLAFTLGIAKSFGFDAFLQREILIAFKEQKDLLKKAMEFAVALISNIQSGVIAGLGLLFLFVSIFGLLENIEKSLNAIWKVDKPRHIVRRWVDYLAIIVICPILFVVSSALTLFINTQVSTIFPNYPVLRELSPFILLLIKFIPYFLSWSLFAFIYLFVPNVRPRILPRIIAAVIAGTLFQLWQQAYFEFQSMLTSYNAVYGSFAALPLFLIWMQVDYMIFLYGAEIAAYIENEIVKISPEQATVITPKTLAVLLLHQLTILFLAGKPPPSVTQLSRQFGIPLNKIRKVVHILEKEEIIGELRTRKSKGEVYQLLVNPELLTLSKISDLIEKNRESPIVAKNSPLIELVTKHFSDLNHLAEQSGGNLNLKEIVDSIAANEL